MLKIRNKIIIKCLISRIQTSYNIIKNQNINIDNLNKAREQDKKNHLHELEIQDKKIAEMQVIIRDGKEAQTKIDKMYAQAIKDKESAEIKRDEYLAACQEYDTKNKALMVELNSEKAENIKLQEFIDRLP
jgi:CRISPR/Cas system-associated endonuclease Cas1